MPRKKDNDARWAALIAAGGSGARMGGPLRKQFIEVGGRSLLGHTLELFRGLEGLVRMVVVLPEDAVREFESTLDRDDKSLITAVAGGPARQESVYNGLRALEGSGARVVAIHDAARPLTSPEVIMETVRLASGGTPAMAAARVRDTVKRESGGIVAETVEREGLWLAQTPQTFPLEMILEAHERARREGFAATDDAALCERAGIGVRLVESGPGNIKVTGPQDLEYLEHCLASGRRNMTDLRIGEGFDIHAVSRGRRMVIGAVEIPFEKGLAGHSDADVLLHAITDSLLGAAALGDIGRLFPDTDPEWEDADSADLLARVVDMIKERGMEIVNLDSTVIAQRPRLSPWIEKIRGRIAAILGIDEARVSVKAKTHEGFDSLGRGEAIAARAIALLSGGK